MAQTIQLDRAPRFRIQIIVNGIVYIPNVTPGVTYVAGQQIVTWDDTHPELFRLETGVDQVIQENA